MLQLFQQYNETLQNLGYENIYKEKQSGITFLR